MLGDTLLSHWCELRLPAAFAGRGLAGVVKPILATSSGLPANKVSLLSFYRPSSSSAAAWLFWSRSLFCRPD